MCSSLKQFATSLIGAFAITVGLSPIAIAHGSKEEKVTPVLKQAVPELPGKNVLMATVELEPGQASLPHLHPGSLFAYVLEGDVVSQLDGEPAITYHAGQAWYEAPRVHHLVTRNPSSTHRAVLMVWALSGEGDPIKRPLPESPEAH
ncbi:MAG: cupin domain-containing protein [Dokdonella sp.]|uniref:cupin domain-containing protein n=1 Tax=Dokdonella sp. TaxID=2291710 RepID=UPI003266D2FF